jgi:hypothetical protein
MASYTGIWDKALEANYIDAWTKSNSETREILTQIANWVDDELRTDPEKKGHERSDISGRVIVIPISQARVSVIYRVFPDDRLVYVTRFIFRRAP